MMLVYARLLWLLGLFATLAAPPPGAHADLGLGGSFGRSGSAEGDVRAPSGVAYTEDGFVWVADTANGRLQRFTRTGALAQVVAGFVRPTGLALAPDGDVYVADPGAGRLVRLGPDGSVDPAFRSDGWTDPFAVAVDTQSEGLYLVERAAGRISRVTTSGAASGPPLEVALRDPTGVSVDASGAVAIAERGSDQVIIRRADGVRQTIGSPGSQPGMLLRPSGVTFDAYGLVVVADEGNGRMQRFTQSGALVDGLAGLGAPFAVASDGAQSFAVADATNDRISLAVDQLEPPRLGVTANAVPVVGAVTVRDGDGEFRPLVRPAQLRLGVEIDTTQGIVRVVTARAAGGTQPSTLSKGRFRLAQPPSGIPQATLSKPLGKACDLGAKRARTAAKRRPPKGRKPIRVVRTKVKGTFRTIGRSATADVRGTDFEVADFCSGTLVTVFDGSVRVSSRGDPQDLVARRSPATVFVPTPPRRR